MPRLYREEGPTIMDCCAENQVVGVQQWEAMADGEGSSARVNVIVLLFCSFICLNQSIKIVVMHPCRCSWKSPLRKWMLGSKNRLWAK